MGCVVRLSAGTLCWWGCEQVVEESRKPKFKISERGRARRCTSWSRRSEEAARRQWHGGRVSAAAEGVQAGSIAVGSSATYGRATARGGTAAAARQRRGGSAAAAWQALNSGSVARVCACECACAVCVWTCARAGGRCGCFRALRVPGGGEGPSGYSEPKASFGPLPRLADATFGVGRCCPPRWQARGRVAGKAGRL